MTTVETHPLAYAEVRRARRYIARRRPAAAARFLMAFQDALNRVGANPLAHAPHDRGTRICHLKRFSYYLVFVIEPMRVYVLACSHDRRRPGYWSRRLTRP